MIKNLFYSKNLKEKENKRKKKKKQRSKRRCGNIDKLVTSGRKRTHT